MNSKHEKRSINLSVGKIKSNDELLSGLVECASQVCLIRESQKRIGLKPDQFRNLLYEKFSLKYPSQDASILMLL